MRARLIVLLGLLVTSLSSGAANAADVPVGRASAAPSAHRELGDSGLRDAGHLAAFIEQLDRVRRSGDVLPVHALDLSLQKAVELELAEGLTELVPGRELRLQIAARIGDGEDGLKRHEAYGTPLTSSADAGDAPTPEPQKLATRKSSPAAEARFEGRRRLVVQMLHQLDGVLDEEGLNRRRDLLVQLLTIARERDQHRRQQVIAAD
jgi:hypothetical protein